MGMLDVDEVIPEVDEVCAACKFYLGPIIGICGCSTSEFAKSLVHPEGFCDQFQRKTPETSGLENGS